MTAYVLSIFAGILTSISPCVLPALPLIVGSAAQQHRHAPLALAFGLVASFTTIGIFLSTIGIGLGIDQSVIRSVAAIILVIFGLILLVPKLQEGFQKLVSPLVQLANNKLSTGKFQGLGGQFGLGMLLGAVWSPCVGPTLGGAIGLASQSGGLPQASMMMLLFGIGSAIPLLFIAYGSRKIFLLNRNRLLQAGLIAKPLLGIVLLIVGTAIYLGWDKVAETYLLNSLPEAWINLITLY